MDVITRTVSFHSPVDDIKDITPLVARELHATGLADGTVTIFVPGATGAISTVEYEPGLVDTDIHKALERIAPKRARYAHNERWHDGNGYSHVRATMLGPSLVVPFVNRELTLGTWQQLVVLNLDNRARTREVILQFMGK